MKRNALSVWTVLCLTALIVVAGCKKPKTSDSDMTVTETVESAEEVVAPPEVDTRTDLERAIESGDLQAINRELSAAGLIGDVYFDLDNFDLKPEARERLSRNADFMKANTNLVFTIEGHCDERGTNEYNLALGDRRANAAKNYLVSLGVGVGGVQTLSYGEERGVCAEAAESCWSRNRRAHFVVTGTGN